MASCKATVCLGKENICKNCIKADVCKLAEEFDKEPVDGIYIEGCDYFKDRNRFVELPCKVGDTVYLIKNYHINECEVDLIWIDTRKSITIRLMTKDYIFYDVSRKYFGKIIFLTREEAERALNNPAKSDS